MTWVQRHSKKIALFAVIAAILFVALHCEPRLLSGQEDFKHIEATGFYLPLGNEVEGKKAFIKFECYTCHQVQFDPSLPAPSVSAPGPILGDIKRLLLPGEFADAIVSPSRHKTKGFENRANSLPQMGEYGYRMSVQELVDIVAYLMAQED